MKILAIVGTYRKGHVIDTAVDEILAAANEAGAETAKVRLIEKRIEFCNNCRECTQEPGMDPGKCVQSDEMAGLIDDIRRADALVIASPMNFGAVTAVTKRFMERLVCFAHWPWRANAPKIRNPAKPKRAVVVASSAAPSLMPRMASPMVKDLKKTAGLLGGRTIGVLFIGLAARIRHQDIGDRARAKARRLGKKLAGG